MSGVAGCRLLLWDSGEWISRDENRGPHVERRVRSGSSLGSHRADRVAPPDRFAAPREYLGFRFPAMKGAPLVESFVCQYENSPDENYILDRHPGCQNAWFPGGGSGHGFKNCPAVGELMADLVEGKKSVPPLFALARFGGR